MYGERSNITTGNLQNRILQEEAKDSWTLPLLTINGGDSTVIRWVLLRNHYGDFASKNVSYRRESLIHRLRCWNWGGGLLISGYGKMMHFRKWWRVHRLAACLWLGLPRTSKLCVLHRCDNPRCFNPDHLFIGTQADNIKDMHRKGRARFGRGRRKLSEADVLFIRETSGWLSSSQLANALKVHKDTIKKVRQGKTWQHVAF